MVETLPAVSEGVGIGDFLARRAKSASDRRIAVDIGVGIVAIYVAMIARPSWANELAAAGWILFSFGFWALFDRMKRPADGLLKRRLILGAQLLFAVSGVASAAMLMFLLWARAIGTWIS